MNLYPLYIAHGTYDDAGTYLVGIFDSLEVAEIMQHKIEALILRAKKLPHPLNLNVSYDTDLDDLTFSSEDELLRHLKWSNFLWNIHEFQRVYVGDSLMLNTLDTSEISRLYFNTRDTDQKLEDFYDF